MHRFRECGSDCVVECREDGQAHRLKANYCGDRWCVPCMNARARVVRDYLLDLIKDRPATFETFTIKRDDKPLTERLNRLLRSFRNLRRSPKYKCYVKQGAFVVQITRGKHKDHWHVHLHVLRLGRPIPKAVLSDLWLSITGDSHQVDSRRVVNSVEDASYVSRYAARGVDRDVTLDHDALVEAVCSLRGRRMFQPFGGWPPCRVEKPVKDSSAWRRVGRLVEVYEAARAGEVWATGIFRSLGVVVSRNSSVPKFYPLLEDRGETIEEPRAPDGQ